MLLHILEEIGHVVLCNYPLLFLNDEQDEPDDIRNVEMANFVTFLKNNRCETTLWIRKYLQDLMCCEKVKEKG